MWQPWEKSNNAHLCQPLHSIYIVHCESITTIYELYSRTSTMGGAHMNFTDTSDNYTPMMSPTINGNSTTQWFKLDGLEYATKVVFSFYT